MVSAIKYPTNRYWCRDHMVATRFYMAMKDWAHAANFRDWHVTQAWETTEKQWFDRHWGKAQRFQRDVATAQAKAIGWASA